MGDAFESVRSEETGLLRIRLLYFAGCPHTGETLDLLRSCARSAGRRVRIEKIEVTSGEEAVRLRFLGSPTVQINGVDIESSARGRTDGAMTCRLYGSSGVPSPEMITAAIREARE